MGAKSLPHKTTPGERVAKDIRRATRRHFSAEDKIRIVLDGLRGEDSIAELCRKEGFGGLRNWKFQRTRRSLQLQRGVFASLKKKSCGT
jgi:transposase-like protein